MTETNREDMEDVRARLVKMLEYMGDRYDKKYELIERVWWAEVWQIEPTEQCLAAVHIHTEDKDELLWGVIEALMSSSFSYDV